MAAPAYAAPPSPLFGAPSLGAPGAPALSESALLQLDWLLEGDEAHSGAGLACHSSAPQPPPPPSGPPWRCLDPSHEPSCARKGPMPVLFLPFCSSALTRSGPPCRCTPAPSDAQAAQYRLADAEGQLTEKRLRALLARCPEWSDAGGRLRLAAKLEAEEALRGDSSGAAEVLRSHSSANMRKRAMLCLAHRWRYKSDCWSTRGGIAPDAKRPRKRPAPDAAVGADASKQLALSSPRQQQQQQQQQTLPLRDRTYVVFEAAQGHVLQMLMPHISAAARAWTGPNSAVQYGRARGAGMTWIRVRSIEGAHEVASWLAAVCRLRLAALRAWRETLSAEQLRSPAYLTDSAYNTPDSELDALRYCTTQGHASTHGVAAAQRAASPAGTLSPQDAAWVQDFDLGHDNALAMIGVARAFMATQRMQSLRTFLDAAEAVVGGIAQYTEETARSLCVRLEWICEAANAQGPAAGLRSEAQARVPPLVERLRLTDDCEQGVALLALARTPPPRGAPPQRFELTTHAR